MGYEVNILFGSILFYTWLAFIMSMGAGAYLNSSIPELQNFQPVIAQETGNPLWDFLTGAWSNLTNFIDVFSIILFNPFSATGFLSWFSISLFIMNLYAIARLIRGGG